MVFVTALWKPRDIYMSITMTDHELFTKPNNPNRNNVQQKTKSTISFHYKLKLNKP